MWTFAGIAIGVALRHFGPGAYNSVKAKFLAALARRIQ